MPNQPDNSKEAIALVRQLRGAARHGRLSVDGFEDQRDRVMLVAGRVLQHEPADFEEAWLAVCWLAFPE
jgi:hypothetical protein